MNESYNLPQDIEQMIVVPKPSQEKVIAVFNPIQSNTNIDKNYEKSIQKHIDFLNQQEQILARDKTSLAKKIQERIMNREPVVYNGQNVYNSFHAMRGSNWQSTLESFNKFLSTNNFFVLDIETLGDSQNRVDPFHISEIALNEYNAQGEVVSRALNAQIRLSRKNESDQAMIQRLENTLNKIKQDKYYFNALPDWEKRTIVDLMRYSEYAGEGFSPYSIKTGSHNTIAQKVMTAQDTLDVDYVIRNMKQLVPYMESGLQTITSDTFGVSKTSALNQLSKVINENPNKFFITYNGMAFDIPVLKAFAEQNKITLPSMNHLDWLNLIYTNYNDSDILKKQVDPEYQGSPYGKNKLASFRLLLPQSDQEGAHNATVDTDDTAKVVAITKDKIQAQAAMNKGNTQPGSIFHPTQNHWNDQSLHYGQELFSNRGYVAYQEGDESFRVRLNEEGKWERVSDGFNKTILNSKTFYQYAGEQELENGKVAFRFFDPKKNEYAFIVRSGDSKTGATPFEQFRDFVQTQFYEFSASEQEIRNMAHAVETDRARRRYERFFSMEGAGAGLVVENGQVVERGTKGFSGLKRMISNAEIMQEYLNGKGEAYRAEVERLRREEGLSEAEAKRRARFLKPEDIINYADQENPSHAKLMDMLDFSSKWDPERKAYVINEGEKNAFFKMYKRLFDEMPYLKGAIERIDAAYEQEIKDALRLKDPQKQSERLKEINQKRDMALSMYFQSVQSQVGSPVKIRPFGQTEAPRVTYFNPDIPKGNNPYNASISFETPESAARSMYRYATSGIDENTPNRIKRIQERADHLMGLLYSQDKISNEQRKMYQQIILDSNSPYEALQSIAVRMREDKRTRFEKNIIEPQMDANPNIKKLDSALNLQMVEQAIRDTNNAQAIMQMNAIPGKRLLLGEELQRQLQEMDRPMLTGLSPNNQRALERLVEQIQKADKTAQIAITMDQNIKGNIHVYMFDPKDSAQVMNQLVNQTKPTNAVEVTLPLITQQGTHHTGNLVLNAHQVAIREEGQIKLISSAEHIALGYKNDLYRIGELRREGKIEEANELAKYSLRQQVSEMAGIQRDMNLSVNDTTVWQNTEGDTLKQSWVKVGNAMVEDYYYSGKLKETDFYDPDSVFLDATQDGKRKLKPGVSLSDVQMEKSYDMLMEMPAWVKDKLGIDVYTNSLKAEQVARGNVSLEDMRRRQTYGSFFNHGRDNLIQYRSAFLIEDTSLNNLGKIQGVQINPLLRTERQAVIDEILDGPNSFDMKVAFMTNDELRHRINQLYQTEEGKKILAEANVLRPDGTLDPIKLPRLYEQQAIIDRDVVNALTVNDIKNFEKGPNFTPSQRLVDGGTILPGEVLGVRTYDNGVKEELRYEGASKATILEGSSEGDTIRLKIEEQPFKFVFDGEKTTDSLAYRQLIAAITGDSDVAAIINPNVYKHKDYGLLMGSEARLLGEYVRSLSGRELEKAIERIENANVGLRWNREFNRFDDISFGKDIKKDAFEKLYEELGIQGINRTKHGYLKGISEVHLAHVYNYSKVSDFTGQRVIDYQEVENPIDGSKIITKTYGDYDGVQWGHREMGLLRRQGLDKTYDHVLQIMLDKQKMGRDIARLTEMESLIDSFRYMTGTDEGVKALSAGQFSPIPEEYRSRRTYQGTIFDRNTVRTLVEQYGNERTMNDRGFWLELPTVELENGSVSKITIDRKKEIDKIFIPFTQLESVHGEVHLQELQRRISNIYRKAAEVNQAESIQDALKAQQELQKAVNNYIRQGFKELSSSEGTLFGQVFKTSMSGTTDGIGTSSASGLFKLMDFEMSKEFGDGQYTVISHDMAKKMGVYDLLKDGKELYVANVRYPVFHDSAMQFTKLAMHESIKPGEIHTTSFASMLLNADSDGDYSHIVFMDDAEIQSEWKKAHDEVEKRFADQWEKHARKLDPSHPNYDPEKSVSLENVVDTKNGIIPVASAISDEETAAKIGKMTIGRASNLNLYISQIADRFYEGTDTHYKMKRFGQGIEQKLIDSKHGADPVALQMIDAIYAGEWDRVKEIDKKYFDSMFRNEFYLDEVSRELPIALQRLDYGLRTKGLKFGTSTGIPSSYGVDNFVRLLDGTADINSELGGRNQALEMYHKYKGIDPIPSHNVEQGPIENINRPMQQHIEVARGMVEATRQKANEVIQDTMDRFRNSMESLKNMSGGRAALLGAGLAVAGLTGYNIFSSDKPEMHYTENKKQLDDMSYDMPKMQNATIQVEASGGKINQDELSLAVTQGMQNTGMNAGPTRISVTYQDNTQQLNRQWYRDTVQEHI